jgi:hypothetical protein
MSGHRKAVSIELEREVLALREENERGKREVLGLVREETAATRAQIMAAREEAVRAAEFQALAAEVRALRDHRTASDETLALLKDEVRSLRDALAREGHHREESRRLEMDISSVRNTLAHVEERVTANRADIEALTERASSARAEAEETVRAVKRDVAAQRSALAQAEERHAQLVREAVSALHTDCEEAKALARRALPAISEASAARTAASQLDNSLAELRAEVDELGRSTTRRIAALTSQVTETKQQLAVTPAPAIPIPPAPPAPPAPASDPALRALLSQMDDRVTTVRAELDEALRDVVRRVSSAEEASAKARAAETSRLAGELSAVRAEAVRAGRDAQDAQGRADAARKAAEGAQAEAARALAQAKDAVEPVRTEAGRRASEAAQTAQNAAVSLARDMVDSLRADHARRLDQMNQSLSDARSALQQQQGLHQQLQQQVAAQSAVASNPVAPTSKVDELYVEVRLGQLSAELRSELSSSQARALEAVREGLVSGLDPVKREVKALRSGLTSAEERMAQAKSEAEESARAVVRAADGARASAAASLRDQLEALRAEVTRRVGEVRDEARAHCDSHAASLSERIEPLARRAADRVVADRLATLKEREDDTGSGGGNGAMSADAVEALVVQRVTAVARDAREAREMALALDGQVREARDRVAQLRVEAEEGARAASRSAAQQAREAAEAVRADLSRRIDAVHSARAYVTSEEVDAKLAGVRSEAKQAAALADKEVRDARGDLDRCEKGLAALARAVASLPTARAVEEEIDRLVASRGFADERAVREALVELRREAAELKGRVSRQSEQSEALAASLSGQLTALATQHSHVSAQVGQITSALPVLKTKVDADHSRVASRADEAIEALALLQQRVQLLSNQSAPLASALEAAVQSVAGLKVTTEDLAGEAAALRGRVELGERTAEKRWADADHLLDRIVAELDAHRSSSAAGSEQLARDLAQARADVGSVAAAVALGNEAGEALAVRVAALETELPALARAQREGLATKADAATLETTRAETLREVRSDRLRVDGLASARDALVADLAGLRREVGDLCSALAAPLSQPADANPRALAVARAVRMLLDGKADASQFTLARAAIDDLNALVQHFLGTNHHGAALAAAVPDQSLRARLSAVEDKAERLAADMRGAAALGEITSLVQGRASSESLEELKRQFAALEQRLHVAFHQHTAAGSNGGGQSSSLLDALVSVDGRFAEVRARADALESMIGERVTRQGLDQVRVAVDDRVGRVEAELRALLDRAVTALSRGKADVGAVAALEQALSAQGEGLERLAQRTADDLAQTSRALGRHDDELHDLAVHLGAVGHKSVVGSAARGKGYPVLGSPVTQNHSLDASLSVSPPPASSSSSQPQMLRLRFPGDRLARGSDLDALSSRVAAEASVAREDLLRRVEAHAEALRGLAGLGLDGLEDRVVKSVVREAISAVVADSQLIMAEVDQFRNGVQLTLSTLASRMDSELAALRSRGEEAQRELHAQVSGETARTAAALAERPTLRWVQQELAAELARAPTRAEVADLASRLDQGLQAARDDLNRLSDSQQDRHAMLGSAHEHLVRAIEALERDKVDAVWALEALAAKADAARVLALLDLKANAEDVERVRAAMVTREDVHDAIVDHAAQVKRLAQRDLAEGVREARGVLESTKKAARERERVPSSPMAPAPMIMQRAAVADALTRLRSTIDGRN